MILSRLKNAFEKFTAQGNKVECACCGKKSRRFFSAGVVTRRRFARCAHCESLERHRLIALMLKDYPLQKDLKILCIAPEEPLTNFLTNSFHAKITTLDLNRTDVDIQGDICALPFQNKTFDMIVSNHVLEHVPDDIVAMKELNRVLNPGGIAILQTPIHWNLEKTEEDIHATPEECLRRFGQTDHVRLYGKDFEQRLRSIDWNVHFIPVREKYSKDEIIRYGLEDHEIFFKIKSNV